MCYLTLNLRSLCQEQNNISCYVTLYLVVLHHVMSCYYQQLYLYLQRFNSLPNDTLLDWSKLKAFADDKKKKCDSKIEICSGKERKHCGKRRKCWLPAFSPFPVMFSKFFYLRIVKSWDCVVKS